VLIDRVIGSGNNEHALQTTVDEEHFSSTNSTIAGRASSRIKAGQLTHLAYQGKSFSIHRVCGVFVGLQKSGCGSHSGLVRLRM
jgi:hypothetical protein